MSSLVSNNYTVPEGSLEICNGVIKKSELGLHDSLVQQALSLDKKVKVVQAIKLQQHQNVMTERVERLQNTFTDRLANKIDEIIDINGTAFNDIEDVCSNICHEVLSTIGAEMSSQEKVSALVRDALKKVGAVDDCTIRCPVGCSVPESLLINAESWNIIEDESLSEDEIIINVNFGKVSGSFNVSFQEILSDLI